MKKKNNKMYAVALYEVTRGLKGEKLNQVLKAFAQLLVKDHRFSQSDRIIAEFERYSRKQEGIVQAVITSARPLKSETLEHVKKALGGKVEETIAIDETLLGGVMIQTDDKILDASLRTQLKTLKAKLVQTKK